MAYWGHLMELSLVNVIRYTCATSQKPAYSEIGLFLHCDSYVLIEIVTHGIDLFYKCLHLPVRV